jgi:3-oxoacyl-[acyl-carrier-protein] synthase II
MRQVVVTGIGLVTPVGIGTKESWQAIINGKSGIAPITRFDTTAFTTKIGGEIKGFEPERFIEKKLIRQIDLFIQFSLVAAQMAIEDANLEITEKNAERVGTIVGVGLGGLETIERYHSIYLEKGPRRISPYFIPMLIANLAPGQISMQFGAKGPNLAPVSACSSGAHAIGDAFKWIQRGDADVMITGGAEATITPLGVGGFCAMKALSTRNDEPERASRPFDLHRDGFVIAEGSGILILEELNIAKKRGAKIYCEIKGYGATADAYHITAPAPEGEGAVKCMEMAIKDAQISKEEIGYINAHGTSTKYNDYNETLAIKTVFKDHARRLQISSTKSMTGHLLGAAGGVESAFCALALHEGILPPTINYETPDPKCDLDYIPNKARECKVKAALSNSFGFGGTNVCLVFTRY